MYTALVYESLVVNLPIIFFLAMCNVFSMIQVFYFSITVAHVIHDIVSGY